MQIMVQFVCRLQLHLSQADEKPSKLPSRKEQTEKQKIPAFVELGGENKLGSTNLALQGKKKERQEQRRNPVTLLLSAPELEVVLLTIEVVDGSSTYLAKRSIRCLFASFVPMTNDTMNW
jgi:hypothetical protein